MELTIDKAGDVINYCSSKVVQLQNDKNLTEEGKFNEFKQLSSNIEGQLKAWENEIEVAQKYMKEELASKKPQPVKRDLTNENLESLKYLSKTLLSKVVAEGNSSSELRSVMDDFLKEGDPMMIQAFLDNYSDFSNALSSKDYDASIALNDYYQSFKRKLKTPEQLAYEEAENKWFLESNSLNTRFSAIKQSLNEIKGRASSATWGGTYK